MNTIQDILVEYEKLFYKDYTYYLENGQIITFTFGKENFDHLFGTHKVKDIPLFYRNNGTRKTAKEIYNLLKKNTVTDEMLKNSSNFDEIRERVEHFHLLDAICKGEIIFWFDKTKARSIIDAQVLIYSKQQEPIKHLHIFLKRLHDNKYVPISFTVEPTNRFIENQFQRKVKKLEITEIKKDDKKKKKK